MRRTILLIAVQLGLTFSTPPRAGAETVQLAFEGQPRSYLIERPAKAGAHPTVIMLHGINGTAERIAQRTGLDQAGPREGFVVVFPQSRGDAWNRFPPGKETPRAKEFFRDVGGPPNDMGFLKRLIADLIQRGLSNQARIYLAGDSGTGGTVASRRVAQAPADGYTLMIGTLGTHGAGPSQYPNLKYDPRRDFTPIGQASEMPFVLVIRK